jgi:hypothetical protein
MKKLTIFKRKVNIALLFTGVVLAGMYGCKKGTFDINGSNPNSPISVLPKYTLSSALAGTANLMYSPVAFNGTVPIGGNQDILNNWMGYWTQSGAYTPSNTYVLYQLTSGTGSGNWDAAYNNLGNYKLMITNSNTASLANYKAVGMIMTAFVYQRIVDLYNSAPFSTALAPNGTFSYKYDSGSVIYKACIAKIDSAVAIIKANPSAAPLGSYDVMFNNTAGSVTEPVEMGLWIKFANTLKLKMLMRQTQSSANGSLGDAGVKAALAGYTTTDFLGVGEDGSVNPGYSGAADNAENPMYLDIEYDASGAPGTNEKYFRANAYGVNFYKTHNDPRDSAFYLFNGAHAIQGRAYGSQNGNEANSVISAISGYGLSPSPSESAPIIPAFESLFLQAEALQRGYITGSTALTTYNSAVVESFRILGIPGYAAAAATYTGQNDPLTNFALAADPFTIIITQKWAACNSLDPLESYSDYRRLGIPAIPVSIYPGVTATHIPYRFPYPTSEINYNGGNVPDGGTGTQSLTSKIFWMP